MRELQIGDLVRVASTEGHRLATTKYGIVVGDTGTVISHDGDRNNRTYRVEVTGKGVISQFDHRFELLAAAPDEPSGMEALEEIAQRHIDSQLDNGFHPSQTHGRAGLDKLMADLGFVKMEFLGTIFDPDEPAVPLPPHVEAASVGDDISVTITGQVVESEIDGCVGIKDATGAVFDFDGADLSAACVKVTSPAAVSAEPPKPAFKAGDWVTNRYSDGGRIGKYVAQVTGPGKAEGTWVIVFVRNIDGKPCQSTAAYFERNLRLTEKPPFMVGDKVQRNATFLDVRPVGTIVAIDGTSAWTATGPGHHETYGLGQLEFDLSEGD